MDISKQVRNYRRDEWIDKDLRGIAKRRPDVQSLLSGYPELAKIVGAYRYHYGGSATNQIPLFVPDVHVHATPEKAQKAHLARVETKLRQNRKATGIPTGRTFEGVYDLMRLEEEKFRELFNQRLVFCLDEVWFSPEQVEEYEKDGKQIKDHPYSFLHYHNQKGILKGLGVDRKDLIIPDCQGDRHRVGSEFGNQISERVGYDIGLVMGSIGPDAIGEVPASPHIAFMRPNMLPSTIACGVELDEGTCNANTIEGFGPYPTHAITIGPWPIIRAEQLLILVTGSNKKENAEDMVLGKFDPAIPSTWVQASRNAVVDLSKTAAQEILSTLELKFR